MHKKPYHKTKGGRKKERITIPMNEKGYNLGGANAELDTIKRPDVQESERHQGYQQCGGGWRVLRK
jgi:hypothetical protein